MSQPSDPDETPSQLKGSSADSAAAAPSDQTLKGGTLYLVATPIGNIGDLSPRARSVLSACDLVACEDTRVTAKLLALVGVSASLLAYHDHNAEKMRPKIMEHLESGKTVALVSDAGTPLVSDPGYRLVEAVVQGGHAVVPIPGPSSVLAALMVAGLPTDRFLFQGFLPAKTTARQRVLQDLAGIPTTLVILESVKRLPASLSDMVEVLGPGRLAAVCRELTKLYEEVRRGSLGDLAAHYAEAGAPKGEAVVVVGPPKAAGPASDGEVDGLLRTALQSQTVKDAVADVTRVTGRARKDVYGRALTLKDEE